jgi:LemA protein
MNTSKHPLLSSSRAGGAGMIALISIVVLLVAGGGCYASTYNKLVGQQENVDAAFSEIDNQYKRRSDLMDQLVATVKGSASYESGVLKEVTEARASVGQMKAPEDPAAQAAFFEAQQKVGGALGRLMLVAEAYPDLKATSNFRDLQTQIEGTENRIAVARRDFIDAIKAYNSKLRGFPGNVIGGMAGFEKKEQPTMATGEERSVPKIDFSDE